MSFRKRNTVLSAAQPSQTASSTRNEKQLPAGLRPSPLDGRLTTSTGTSSLDHLLAGHIGLPLGTCLLVEEQGTTDFAGVLLRYYAAEGLVQGHQVHAVGVNQNWRHDLPGVADDDGKHRTAKQGVAPDEKMKIAWRYEALGNASNSAPATRAEADPASPFSHTFDLTKRLHSTACKGTLHPVPMEPISFGRQIPKSQTPLKSVITALETKLAASGPNVVHRLAVPSLLLPSLYPPGCSHPSEVLQFLHALRALLRQYSTQLTALITLPTSLFPRSAGLTRWMELLCDGVVELIPMPSQPGVPDKPDSKNSDNSQGLLRVHSLPVYHEKGGGGAENTYFREDLTFSLSSSRGLVIKPYSLPPLGDESQKEKQSAGAAKDGIDF
ncbi:PAXNEB-domain-containing protein [Thozetella sp. PMI_491]|nr:PAXNEB-domain-containing protein [Thozetella sp. PMI_491]